MVRFRATASPRSCSSAMRTAGDDEARAWADRAKSMAPSAALPLGARSDISIHGPGKEWRTRHRGPLGDFFRQVDGDYREPQSM